MKKLAASTLAIASLLLAATSGQASVTIVTIVDGNTFDGDAAGGTAGPFSDPVSGLSSTITTVSVAPDGVLNSTSTNFGINAVSGADSSSEFDLGEAWTFTFDKDIQFEGIDFNLFGAGEMFMIQSAAFVGRSITPGSSAVSFNSTTGTFTFSDKDASDNFSKVDIAGSATLGIGSGVNIVFSVPATGSSISVENFTVAIVPEPGTFAMILGGAGVLTLLRRRR